MALSSHLEPQWLFPTQGCSLSHRRGHVGRGDRASGVARALISLAYAVVTLLSLGCTAFADSWESQTLVGREGGTQTLNCVHNGGYVFRVVSVGPVEGAMKARMLGNSGDPEREFITAPQGGLVPFLPASSSTLQDNAECLAQYKVGAQKYWVKVMIRLKKTPHFI